MSAGETSPRSYLTIGSTGQLKNLTLHLKGYVRCTASDDEDTWYWEEWYAVTNDGQEIWLEFEEDTEQYTLFQKLDPATLSDPEAFQAGESFLLQSGEQVKIKESATGKIVEAHGELPEGNIKGAVFVYHESTVTNGYVYTVEESDELEIFKGERVKPLIVFKAFNLVTALASYEWKKSQEKLWQFGRQVCFAVIALGLVGFWLASTMGKLVFNQTLTTCTGEWSSCTGEEHVLGPVTLTKTNRAHQIQIRTQKGISQKNWQAVTVTLLDESMQPVSAIEGDFWEEAWKEGGESGVEGSTSKDKYFRLTKAGTYYLRTTIEPASATSTPITLSIRLYENVLYWPYFVSLVLGGFGIVGIKDKWYENIEY